MNYNNLEQTNHGRISGMVCSDVVLSHQVEGENFWEFKLEVARLSEAVDIIPVTISERTTVEGKIKQGDFLTLEGEYRSYNKIVNEKSKLILHFFAKNIAFGRQENINEIKLMGFICKEPVYRKTPFEREICDILLAVNRPNYHKTDYIPCILWGRNARFIASQSIGCKLELTGRIQSREYKKQHDDGQVENMVAYEVSCQNVGIVGNLTNYAGQSGFENSAVNN